MHGLQILIVDDHTLFRTGLCMILGQCDGISQTLEAAHVMDAIHLHQTSVDIILLDIHMPGLNGLEGIKLLRNKFSQARIIMLSASDEAADIQKAADCGASGFLHKSANADVILDTLFKVAGGENCFPENMHSNIADHKKVDPSQLTARQLEVLTLLCEGKPNKIIARELQLAENTVRVHISAILHSLNVHNRSEVIIAAQRSGLIGI